MRRKNEQAADGGEISPHMCGRNGRREMGQKDAETRDNVREWRARSRRGLEDQLSDVEADKRQRPGLSRPVQAEARWPTLPATETHSYTHAVHTCRRGTGGHVGVHAHTHVWLCVYLYIHLSF